MQRNTKKSMYACATKLSFLNYLNDGKKKSVGTVKEVKWCAQEEAYPLHVPIFNWRCSWTWTHESEKTSVWEKVKWKKNEMIYFVFLMLRKKNDRRNNGFSNSNIVQTKKKSMKKNTNFWNQSIANWIDFSCETIISTEWREKNHTLTSTLETKTIYDKCKVAASRQ